MIERQQTRSRPRSEPRVGRSVKRFRLGIAFRRWRSVVPGRPIGVRGGGQPAAQRPAFFPYGQTSKTSLAPRTVTSLQTSQNQQHACSRTPKNLTSWLKIEVEKGSCVRPREFLAKIRSNPLKSVKKARSQAKLSRGVRTNRTSPVARGWVAVLPRPAAFLSPDGTARATTVYPILSELLYGVNRS